MPSVILVLLSLYSAASPIVSVSFCRTETPARQPVLSDPVTGKKSASGEAFQIVKKAPNGALSTI